MDTVLSRAKKVKQPRGGYLPPSSFEVIKKDDGIELGEENIGPGLIGSVVDYMTRFLDGTPVEEAFSIPLQGSKLIKKEKEANELLKQITDLDEKSLIAACKLVAFDSVLRAGLIAYKPYEEINPDDQTILNLIVMIKRTQFFLREYGPIIEDGMTFLGAYTPTVVSGDADFMTEDTLWDLKVSKNPIKSFQTLQLLMYYLMGCRAIKLNAEYDFKNRIKKIGIYNPRKNEIYIKNVNSIDKSIIKEVEQDVIGYGEGVIDPHMKTILNSIIENKK